MYNVMYLIERVCSWYILISVNIYQEKIWLYVITGSRQHCTLKLQLVLVIIIFT